jgi:hypothetical protein
VQGGPVQSGSANAVGALRVKASASKLEIKLFCRLGGSVGYRRFDLGLPYADV